MAENNHFVLDVGALLALIMTARQIQCGTTTVPTRTSRNPAATTPASPHLRPTVQIPIAIPDVFNFSGNRSQKNSVDNHSVVPSTTTPPTWSVPLVLDPEAVKVTGNQPRITGKPLSSTDLFEGDILGLGPDAVIPLYDKTEHNLDLDEDRHWPNGTVPYIMSTMYRPKDKQTIREAIDYFMLKSPVKFRDRKDTDKDYVHFAPGYGCSSFIGKEGSGQIVSLQVPDCMKRGLILHELMHVTGFYHEQARIDRDNYVEINWKNIPEGMHNRFQSYDKEIMTFGKPYDFASILHYGMSEFAIDNEEWTIRPRKNKTDYSGADQIGQRFGLSLIDVGKLKLAFRDEKDAACPKADGWKRNQNSCYFFSFLTDSQRSTFRDAKTFCRTIGARIAPEPSATLSEFFQSQMHPSLFSDTRVYVAGYNTITPSNVTEIQEEVNCTTPLHFICSKRISVM